MKYKLLVPFTTDQTNIGDYIQALASSKFLPHIDGFIDRDNLSSYNEEECCAIMNAWYMDKPENWPPSELITPLFIAVHFNSGVICQMINDRGGQYLKHHEPIGCRDLFTRDQLQKKGIDAYFSGCMTLTLGSSYTTDKRSDKVYIVDPLVGAHWNCKEFLSVLLFGILNFISVIKIYHRFYDRHNPLIKLLRVAKFCKEYSKYFSMDILTNAEYLSHKHDSIDQIHKTHIDKLHDAESIVEKYASARLVITSRIHCALPCLGMQTPVVFIDNANSEENSNCRFGGLKELFNVLSWNGKTLLSCDGYDRRITSMSAIPQNKDNWKPIAEQLRLNVSQWINQLERIQSL